jgi:hypothetical protein
VFLNIMALAVGSPLRPAEPFLQAGQSDAAPCAASVPYWPFSGKRRITLSRFCQFLKCSQGASGRSQARTSGLDGRFAARLLRCIKDGGCDIFEGICPFLAICG